MGTGVRDEESTSAEVEGFLIDAWVTSALGLGIGGLSGSQY